MGVTRRSLSHDRVRTLGLGAVVTVRGMPVSGVMHEPDLPPAGGSSAAHRLVFVAQVVVMVVVVFLFVAASRVGISCSSSYAR